MVAGACRRDPSVPAVIFEDGLAMSRDALLRRAQQFAGYLMRHTEPGERVALMLDNRIECMIVFIALLLSERILVSVNPASRTRDALHVLRDSESVMLITSPAHEKLVAEIRPGCPKLRYVAVMREPEPDGLVSFEPGRDLPQPEGCHAGRRTPATIYYTSGTTGLPKGCVLGHEWWLRLCDIHLRTIPPQAPYRPLCCVPFYYADSMFQLLCALHMGGTLIAMRRFSVSRFWPLVAHQGVSELYLLAAMPVLLLKQAIHPLERQHKLRVAICAPVPKALHRQLVERFGVQFIDSYGTTESGWNIRVPWRLADRMVESGAMGVALPETELRIVDGEGADVATDCDGELLIRAPGLFLGYLTDPEATARALHHGWYRTGDLVRRDAGGFVYFVGRMKDVVRRSGETIAAAEVEAVLRDHPRVRDAAIVPVPDDIRGEEAMACIWSTNLPSLPEKLAQELIDHCAARLAAYKVPRYWRFQTEDFSRTPTMKVRKEELLRATASSPTWDLAVNCWIAGPRR
jgi:crotonobetaine/carnitine-CoA ligase